MGLNTVVVMLNDRMQDWPDDIREALQRHRPDSGATTFGRGKVISSAHASHRQIVSIHDNTGAILGSTSPVAPEDLEAMALILRGHGYTIKGPDQKQGLGPLSYGYAAKRKVEDPPAN